MGGAVGGEGLGEAGEAEVCPVFLICGLEKGFWEGETEWSRIYQGHIVSRVNVMVDSYGMFEGLPLHR